MVELNEKALEAARNAIRADDVGDPLRLSDPALDTALGRVIRAYLAAIPAPDDGLEVVAWRWPEPHVEGGALYSVTNVEPPCSGWQGLVRLSDAQAALQSKDEQIERLTRKEAESFQQFVDANEARLDAEQQVQKLREALRPFARISEAEEYADTPPGKSVIMNVDLCHAARSAIETQEGGK